MVCLINSFKVVIWAIDHFFISSGVTILTEMHISGINQLLNSIFLELALVAIIKLHKVVCFILKENKMLMQIRRSHKNRHK